MAQDTKRCATCRAVKPLQAFNADSTQSDGHATHCRSCRSMKRRAQFRAEGRMESGSPELRLLLSEASRRARIQQLWPLERQEFMEAHPDLRWCPQCEAALPLDRFRRYTQGYRQRFSGYCLACLSMRDQIRRERVRGDPELYARSRAEAHRNSIKFHYGLEVADYEALMARQGNACAICGIRTAGCLHVDHDHQTGRVRGLLCSKCNHALGFFSDNLVVMTAAIDYLKAVPYLDRPRSAPQPPR